MAGSASSSRTYDARQLERLLECTERAIADLEAQNEAGDEPAAPRLPTDLAEAKRLRAEVMAARQALAAGGRRQVNLTDPDARLLRAAGGYLTGYNAQAVAVTVRYEAGAAGPVDGSARGTASAPATASTLATKTARTEATKATTRTTRTGAARTRAARTVPATAATMRAAQTGPGPAAAGC